MPKRYPAEFRQRVLDLVREGRTVAGVAAVHADSFGTYGSPRVRTELVLGQAS
jgi:transposase-like protein